MTLPAGRAAWRALQRGEDGGIATTDLDLLQRLELFGAIAAAGARQEGRLQPLDQLAHQRRHLQYRAVTASARQHRGIQVQPAKRERKGLVEQLLARFRLFADHRVVDDPLCPNCHVHPR